MASPTPTLSPADHAAFDRLVGRPDRARFVVAAITGATDGVRSRQLREATERLQNLGFHPIHIALDADAPPNLWKHLHDLRLQQAFDAVLLTGTPTAPPLAGTPDRALDLNVQRDVLRRDFAFPWVVITSPIGATYLRTRAPDFTDFVSLWIDGPQVERPTRAEFPRFTTSGRPMVPAFDDAFLQAAVRSAQDGRFDQANDTLSRYDIAGRPNGAERLRAEATLALLRDEVSQAASLLLPIPTHGIPTDQAARLAIPAAQIHLRRGEREAAEARLSSLDESALPPDLRAGVLRVLDQIATWLTSDDDLNEATAVRTDEI